MNTGGSLNMENTESMKHTTRRMRIKAGRKNSVTNEQIDEWRMSARRTIFPHPPTSLPVH